MVIRLITITTIPTATNIFRIGNLDVSIAEKGAVTIPPIKRPATIFQWWMPMVNIKVTALTNVRINFATVELPITYRGVRPFLIKVPVTNGPQPPPPNESINPPIRPRTGILVFFLTSDIFLLLKAVYRLSFTDIFLVLRDKY